MNTLLQGGCSFMIRILIVYFEHNLKTRRQPCLPEKHYIKTQKGTNLYNNSNQGRSRQEKHCHVYMADQYRYAPQQGRTGHPPFWPPRWPPLGFFPARAGLCPTPAWFAQKGRIFYCFQRQPAHFTKKIREIESPRQNFLVVF